MHESPATALAGDGIRQMLALETRALLTRVERVKPFVLYETMVLAAAPSIAAQTAIEGYLARGRHVLRRLAQEYLAWLHSPQAAQLPVAEAQRRYAILKLHFNTMLSQFDIFADVITQRSEHDNGVWLSGLDVVAADALDLPGGFYDAPPVVCYLQRGHGAAIRRARTRLPGGGENPVAIIQVPRERMVGSGIASSLVHEVGHQGAALLGLVSSLQPVLQGMQRSGPREAIVWQLWERWISEILSDLWSVARVGIAGTMGLMSVVSLPAPFVFRVGVDDPHPIPWVRVKLSAALGDALYPDPQWRAVADTWEVLYPKQRLTPTKLALLDALEQVMPAFVSLVVHHRPRSLRGASLKETLATPDRTPTRLRAVFEGWRGSRLKMQAAPPSLVLAAIGQAKADGRLSPERESRIAADLLTDWAMQSSLDTSAICATRAQTRVIPTMTWGRQAPAWQP